MIHAIVFLNSEEDQLISPTKSCFASNSRVSLGLRPPRQTTINRTPISFHLRMTS